MNTKAVLSIPVSIAGLSTGYENTPEWHGERFKELEQLSSEDGLLLFHKRYGDYDNYGYIQFNYLLKVIFSEMKHGSRYLEIGVYKGQTLSLMLMLSTLYGKKLDAFGISTFDGLGDKYSTYPSANFFDITNSTCRLFSGKEPVLYRGNSTDLSIVSKVQRHAPFDCVFIDGGHDYQTVCSDIKNYSWQVCNGGYLIFDDACCDRKMNPEVSFSGHDEVTRAVNDSMGAATDFRFLFAIANVKVFQRIL